MASTRKKRQKRTTLQYQRDMLEEDKKKRAKKVKLDLDEYHRRMGGIYDKKVIFYCVPDDQLKTKRAQRIFEKNGGPENGLFITITDSEHEETKGITYNKEQDFSLNPIVSFIIIDNIHLLSVKKIINILNKFRSSVMTGRLLCFGTNADKDGKPILGARHLEKVSDQVHYETGPCYFCEEYGKVSFTKTLFEKQQRYPSDCGVEEDIEGAFCYVNKEEDGYYYKRDLCFGCRNRKIKKD